MKIKIAIVDDDALFARLLGGYLNTQEHIAVCVTAHGGQEFFKLLETPTNLPDVLLLDLKLQELDGVEITQYLQQHYPSIKIIVVSSHYQRSFLGFMLKAGVSAFLPKGVSPEDLVEIIETVYHKGFYFMEDQVITIREQLSSRTPQPVLEPQNVLTDREIDVLRLISLQKTAKEIGDMLFITQRTVEGRKNTMFLKTGAKNLAGLVIYAIQNNIIRVEDLPQITT